MVAFLLRSCFGGSVTHVCGKKPFSICLLHVLSPVLPKHFKWRVEKSSVKINLNCVAVTFLWPVAPSMGKFFLGA